MPKSFAEVEQDLRFQLDLVKLAEALESPSTECGNGANHQAGAIEELVRVQRMLRPGNRFNV